MKSKAKTFTVDKLLTAQEKKRPSCQHITNPRTDSIPIQFGLKMINYSFS